MEDHVQKFRKTKHRAKIEFDQIVAEHTKKLENEVFDLEKELKSMEAKREQNKKTKEKAKEIEDVVKNHQIKESKTDEVKSDEKQTEQPENSSSLSPTLSLLAILLGSLVAGYLFKIRSK